jgi:hypothetical protein
VVRVTNQTDPPLQNSPPLRDQVLAQMGGWQGMVYSTLPVVAFVPVNALAGLAWASGAALGVALVILVIRLLTRTSVQPAVSGFFGVLICVVIALLLGGRWYFAYGIVSQAVLAVLFLGSIVIGRPLVGVLWHMLREPPEDAPDWRTVPGLRRTFIWLTLAWTVAFAFRFVVQGMFFLHNSLTGLGVARIVLGWPVFAAMLLLTFWVGRRVEHAPQSEVQR